MSANFLSHLIVILVYFHLVSKKDPYIDAFQATGCPNKNPYTGWWKAQSDNRVLDDMESYCELTRVGKADDRQRKQCCGAKNCIISKCIRQSAIGNGNNFTKDFYEYNK